MAFYTKVCLTKKFSLCPNNKQTDLETLLKLTRYEKDVINGTDDGHDYLCRSSSIQRCSARSTVSFRQDGIRVGPEWSTIRDDI